MAIFGYVIMKRLVFNLIDEVYDEGDSLLFRNSEKEARVFLRDIHSVSYQTAMKPQRVTLHIRHETDLGNTLSFIPPLSIPFTKNRDIEELITRIDQARATDSPENWG
jgi:hypothetical protein